jgi:hypothetical protein
MAKMTWRLFAAVVLLGAGALALGFYALLREIPAPTEAAVGGPALPRHAGPRPPGVRVRPDAISAVAAMARAEMAMAADEDGAAPAWRTQIDEALGVAGGPEAMAEALYRLLPGLPPEGQEEAAFEMVALLGSDNYTLARNLLLSASTPPGVWSVVLDDLEGRPDSLRLPVLRELADGPRRVEVRRVLDAIAAEDDETAPGSEGP